MLRRVPLLAIESSVLHKVIPEDKPRRAYSTKVIHGLEKTTKKVMEVFTGAEKLLCGLGDSSSPSVVFEVEEYYKLYGGLKSRGVNHRIIIEITKENLPYCKRLIREFSSDLRHLDSVKGNFVVTEQDYLATTVTKDRERVAQVFFSNEPVVVEQNRYLFDTLWNKATPAEERFKEIEEGTKRYQTKIIRDSNEILEETKRMADTSDRYSVSSVSGGLLYAYNYAFDQFKSILERHRTGVHGGIRWLTTIDKSCTEAARKFIELGMEIRHVDKVPSESFGFSTKEVGVTLSQLEGGTLNNSALFSNDPIYINHYSTVFEELWKSGVNAETRIKEIQEGIEQPKIRIIRNREEIQELYLELIGEAKEEILLILPTVNAYIREVKIGVMDALRSAAFSRQIKVRMLAPAPDRIEHREFDLEPEAKLEGSLIAHKIIRQATTPNTVTVLVVDRTSSLIIEQENDSNLNFTEAIGVGTYSTRGSTVKANIRFFERLWEEVEELEREELLLEKERRSRKEAELLQDILTHDLRNFSQVTRLSAEILAEELNDNVQVQSLVHSLLTSLEQTNELLDRAKKLGKAVAEGNPILTSVDLGQMIENAMSVLKNAHPEKRIIDQRKIWVEDEENYPLVLADDLLYEVFLNLYSNAIKYTDGKDVLIETSIEEESKKNPGSSSPSLYWNVTVSDRGRGIPDEMKGKIFSRYLQSAKGSGLGMSIVHALVVERYRGMVLIKNRVDGDYRQGTSVEIWLPKAVSR